MTYTANQVRVLPCKGRCTLHARHLAFQDLGSRGVGSLLGGMHGNRLDTPGCRLSEVLLWCLVGMVASYWLLSSLVAEGTFVLAATLFDEGMAEQAGWMALRPGSATGYPSDVVSSMKGR